MKSPSSKQNKETFNFNATTTLSKTNNMKINLSSNEWRNRLLCFTSALDRNICSGTQCWKTTKGNLNTNKSQKKNYYYSTSNTYDEKFANSFIQFFFMEKLKPS